MQKLTRSFVMTGALAFAGVLAGCGDDVTVGDNLAVTVTPTTANVAVGGSVTLTASVTGNNSNKNVTWSTSDAAKATVDGTGKVTGVAVGQATITATAAADANIKSSALVTVTTPNLGVQSVTVSPNNQILKVGEFIQATANVTRNPGVAGTVTWSSSANTIATVDATGKVTAVANGAATITAASTVDPTVTGNMALTVRPLTPAQISIQKVTTGSTQTPVNPNNIQGQIDVTLNLDPGDQTVTKVEVLLDGVVACSQNLSVQESQQLSLAAAFDELQAVDIVCTINTAEFDATNGTVKYLNGTKQLTARATITGNQAGNVASPSVALIFNNQSGFIATVTNANTVGGAASAINPTTGLKWVQGDVTLKLTAVNYAAGGATVSQLSGAFLGKAFTATNPTGQVFTIAFPNSGTTPLNIVGYQTPVASSQSLPVVTGSTLSTGSTGPTNVLNVGPTAANFGLTPLDSTRVDNVAPTVPAFTAAPLWVTATSAFTAGQLGTPATALTTDTGVDAVTATFYATAENGALTGASGSCNLTGTTAITTGSQLNATIINTAYKIRVVYRDALGNPTCSDLVGTGIGADFAAPADITFAGVANNAAFNNTGTASGTSYILASTGDNASGISLTTPGLVSILRVNSTGANTCVVGSGTTCAQVAAAGTASITGGSAGEGYYTVTAQMTDIAGNAGPTPAFTRLFLVDATAPTFTGNVGLAAQYAGNAAATFSNLSASDNLDLSRLFGVVQYGAAGVNLEYPALSIGTYGLPLEKTFAGNYTIPSLIRCINPANTFAVNAGAEATQITFVAEDQAGNQGTVAPVVGALAAALDNCGAVGALTAPAAINTFNDVAASYGAGKSQVSIAGTTTGVNSANVVLSAIADVTLDNSPEPFARVEFYYQNAAGNWVRIGQAPAGTLLQGTTTRTWTYTFTWDPDASVAVNAATNVIAIGIDAQGDAVRTAGVTVNVAP
jgi:hypothetical protein